VARKNAVQAVLAEADRFAANVLPIIREAQKAGATTLREIAVKFGFRSHRAAACHLEALKHKGFVESESGKARSLRVTSPLAKLRNRIMDIPLYGSIPAGFADAREQEPAGKIAIDAAGPGFRPNAQTFALEVRGDSMVGKHILEGDHVILDGGGRPKPGDVVAALIDNESTLKTLVMHKGKPCLRAENPSYPKLIPASHLVIQGVMVGLIRRLK
jgi:repressor LexA